MSRIAVCLGACLLLTCVVLPLCAQQPVANATNAGNLVVPPLVNFSGVLTEGNGKPPAGVVGVTFALYTEPQGGTPLWLETQNVYPDRTGRYSVMLGSTSSAGIPLQIFAAGEARWLGVQPQGQAEQPRVSLLSVPYAMKAADAQTVGGLSPSAFVLASPATPAKSSSPSLAKKTGSTPNLAGSGTQNYVPLWL